MTPTAESILGTLPQERLLDLSRAFGFGYRGSESKRALLKLLSVQLGAQLPAIVRELGRDELRAACRAHTLPADARSRQDLQASLLKAAGFDPSRSVAPPPDHHADGLPAPGQVVHARHRQWLVERVTPGELGESPLVSLVCLDDDAPGRALDILWDLELGARVMAPETHGLGTAEKLDPPTHFGAYLHALKWSAVSAADPERFQAPFRAGIKLMAHQLTPLMKALQLPRANLFIADDVGLGKTIEAGLVLQELLLRQQADFVLIVCPASICLQWRTEMQRRFGLRFEVMTRQFTAYRRQERGFGVNPWATHNRFIISHQLLRRAEYIGPLTDHLGPRARKGLLILDEAHVAAPASRTHYAVDSEITRTIRDLAPRFDNRLFLSATPHNGHSNSFGTLLSLLDPIRFRPGDTVTDPGDLAPIMVRRLKRDLRKIGNERYPQRLLVRRSLTHTSDAWAESTTSFDSETGTVQEGPGATLHQGAPVELQLGEQLARYTELCSPKSSRGGVVFIRLQQRLLSSPEAFARSLEAHAGKLHEKGGVQAHATHNQVDLPLHGDDLTDPETHGDSDDALDTAADRAIATHSASLPTPNQEAAALLDSMRTLAQRARRVPDAKTRALFAWLREHLCPALGLTPEEVRATSASTEWTERRVILFTEWADTKRYLLDLLRAATDHTSQADERVMAFHGGMGDDARADVQRAFNADPKAHPVRILVATDAAREGINLQAHCTDLFHIDLPWNPARLEQRNGRIDRTLQPAAQVRCHYFVYPQRAEDRVLETLVRKVDVVQRELGSLGAVLFQELTTALEGGITAATEQQLALIGEASTLGPTLRSVDAELEAQRKDLKALTADVQRAGRLLDASKKALEVDPENLRGVVEVGLRMAGAEGLGTHPDATRACFTLPQLDRSWERTLDSLRPPRERSESFWEWRQRPLLPVTFAPLERLDDTVEQLHLAHPFVRRILDRFLAQGFSAHDLSRVTSVVAPGESVIRVVAYARLSLFGPGAVRLHDEILPVAAPWPTEDTALTPYRDAATAQKAIAQTEALLAQGARAPGDIIQQRIRQAAPQLFAGLWPALEA